MDNLIKKIKKNKYTIIYFWAEWCNPCLYIKPIIKKIYKKYKNKIYIKKINIDKYKKITELYNIQSVPTIIFLKNGKVIDIHIGIININKMEILCNKLLII